ncbi:MAG: ATP-binding cassette domain-containing protein [Culicoidibacterales bacterium]
MNSLTIKNLIKTRKNFKLNIESLALTTNNIYGLVGENGAGKTTFLKCLSGLICSDNFAEQIHFNNILLTHVQRTKTISSNFIENNFFLHLTLFDIYADYSTYYSLTFPSYSLDNLLQKIQLNIDHSTVFKDLSLGMRQQFMLALTYYHSPKVILLDEPFNGLDRKSTQLFIKNIQDLAPDTIIIMSSHDSTTLELVADTIISLQHGQIHTISSKFKQ